jgi:PPOX class probable F420-dependent enzyme
LTITLNDQTRALLDQPNFAVLSTLGPDGRPHSAVIWVDRDGDTVVFSTTAGRQKARNIAKDARVSVAIFDLKNPYNSAEIRGSAELVDDPGKTLPVALSHKYLGVDPPNESEAERRLIIRVSPEKVTNFSV